jgi:hypothetical protein
MNFAPGHSPSLELLRRGRARHSQPGNRIGLVAQTARAGRVTTSYCAFKLAHNLLLLLQAAVDWHCCAIRHTGVSPAAGWPWRSAVATDTQSGSLVWPRRREYLGLYCRRTGSSCACRSSATPWRDEWFRNRHVQCFMSGSPPAAVASAIGGTSAIGGRRGSSCAASWAC